MPIGELWKVSFVLAPSCSRCTDAVNFFRVAANASDFFWIPFKTDCEELLGRFQQTMSVRYEEFAAIWKTMDFSSVFYGYTTRHEKRAFSRLAFATVYNYFLPPYSFQIRVGAMYMLYGLYHTQLVWPKEKVWIALKDWVHVQRFVSDAFSCQHLDVVYIYQKLVSERAFLYTAMPKPLAFDAKRRFFNKNINEEFQDHPSRVPKLVNINVLEEIANVHAHYERIKKGLSMSSSVSVTLLNLTGQLQKCALEFQQWQEKNTKTKKKGTDVQAKKNTEQLESSRRAATLASIKSKSYTQLSKASKSRRHRQVEMDTSGSGTDQLQEQWTPRGRRPPSLRARTWQNLGKKASPKGSDERRKTWLLTAMEEDKSALVRYQNNRFKW
ncbi:snRNA-activating protein complex subunit 1a [Electrophorus electricus]|uniref:snRNA-activating protein complex subunit 1a n=1 Tax=Electrophorus electricus TaxID=8005 RepID=UPI0015D085EB|nr:snRNA-activating protein complex subunit 1a [Electrophorus electricus]